MTTDSNMRFSVRNYGPIAKAEGVELRPLTVFVGPSNTGKSYLAILVYAFCRVLENGLSIMGHYGIEGDYSHMDKEIKHFLNQRPKDTPFSDFPEQLQGLILENLTRMLGKPLHQEILRCMGISPQEKKTLMNRGFNLRIEDCEKTLILTSRSTTININHLNFPKEQHIKLHRYLSGEREAPKGTATADFLNSVLMKIVYSYDEGVFVNRGWHMTRSMAKEPFYFPAARTGIMQGYRAITSALVQKSSYADFEKLVNPILNGILSDFLQEIIRMSIVKYTPNKDVGKIADDMERNILKGKVGVEFPKGIQSPQSLYYEQGGRKISLLRSSSMVTELAPIVLSLKHRVKKGDLLIIEEPESHLHPAAQRDIVKVIVALVRAGVRVMITTHSDYVLEQLGIHVLQSQLPDKENRESDNEKFLAIREEDVGVYSFQEGEKGTVVKRKSFDRDGGYSPEDHNRVSSDIYNQTARLLDKTESGR